MWLKHPHDVLTPAHGGRQNSTSLRLLVLWLPFLPGTQTERGAEAAMGLWEATDQPWGELLLLPGGLHVACCRRRRWARASSSTCGEKCW